MHFIKWIPIKKILRWSLTFILILCLFFLQEFLSSNFLSSNNQALLTSTSSNVLQSQNDPRSNSFKKPTSKTNQNTPITRRAHILIITKSPQSIPNRHSNKNLLIMKNMLESLRFKFTIYSVTNTKKTGTGVFPSLVDKNDENKGRFSLLNIGL